jgi:hypothetical protein
MMLLLIMVALVERLVDWKIFRLPFLLLLVHQSRKFDEKKNINVLKDT